MKRFIKNYQYNLVLIVCITVLSPSISAQVSIGSLEKPEEYVTLKVDNEDKLKGLRLNRLTTAERNALPIKTTQEKESAKGLLIYNETESRLEYFDGQEWKAFSGVFPATVANGLSLEGNKVMLGGKLSEETVISQGGHPLNFNIRTSETGTFTIDSDKSTVFTADKTGAAFKNVEEFSINKGIGQGSIDMSTGTIKINTGTKGLNVNNNALSVKGDNIGVSGTLVYVDGTQSEGRVIQANDEGQAEWFDIIPEIEHKTFNVSIGEITKISEAKTSTKGRLPGPSQDFKTISEEVELEPGKWLITGTFFAYTNANTAQDGGATSSTATGTGNGVGAGVVKIVRTDNTTVNPDYYVTGVIPEVKSTGYVYLSASVSAYIEVTGDTPWKFVIQAKGHSVGTSTNPDYYTYLLKGGTGSEFIGFDPKGRGNSMKAMRVEKY